MSRVEDANKSLNAQNLKQQQVIKQAQAQAEATGDAFLDLLRHTAALADALVRDGSDPDLINKYVPEYIPEPMTTLEREADSLAMYRALYDPLYMSPEERLAKDRLLAGVGR